MSERKRQKTTTTSRSKFEDFPNELIFSCFRYLDFYDLYESFSDLNQHFNQLIVHHTKFYINFDSIPHGKLLTFCIALNQFITTSQNYPSGINISGEIKTNLIFNDDLFQEKFSKLKSLSIGDIKADTLSEILRNEKMKLYKTLQRVNLSYNAYDKNDDVPRKQWIFGRSEFSLLDLCSTLTSAHMEALKYVNLDFERYSCGCDYSLYTRDNYINLQFDFSGEEKSFSNLETLIIGCIPKGEENSYYIESATQISFITLTKDLLPYLPKLKKLIINSLNFNEDSYQRHHLGLGTIKTKSIVLLNLQFIKIWLNLNENQGEDRKQKREIVQKFFLKKNSFPPTTLQILDVNL